MLSFFGVCMAILLVFSSFIVVEGKPQQTKPGCRYEGKRYQEGEQVSTAEPCLQCRCIDGSLSCRLRVCPRLPQPAPIGCRIHKPPGNNICCPELICGNDEDENENILQRSNAAISHHPKTQEGCLYEGVRYGPGSAMMGSRRCEYCYCISGSRRCIRPKCLLPLPGCAPLYAPHSCCPVAYNCTRQAEFSTTLAAITGNGCRIGQRLYQEGEMVRDIAWKAACDNCFCAMGAIRCVPLACAPPLQGCKPIVREGQCCPSTYNCSGTIEVKAAQNYASYAFISKDYAKFRKETNFYPAIHDMALSSVEGRGHRVVNEALETSSSDGVSPEIITEKFTMATESMPTLETETMNNEILGETTDYPKHTTRDQEQLTATTTELSTSTEAVNYDEPTTIITTRDPISDETGTTLISTAYQREVSTTLEDALTESVLTTSYGNTSTLDDEDITTTIIPITDLPRESTTTTTTTVTTPTPSSSTTTSTTTKKSSGNCVSQGQELKSTSSDKVRLESTTSSINSSKASTIVSTPKTMTTISTATKISASNLTTTTAKPSLSNITLTAEVTSQSTLKQEKLDTESTTKRNNNNSNSSNNKTTSTNEKVNISIAEDKISMISVKKPTGGLSTSIIVPDDMLVMNVTVKTNVAVGHIHGVTINPIGKPIPPDIEAILNITNRGKGDDYEYDYSEPTLPPSLPNVRIIPFVAADALVKDKDVEEPVPSSVTGYPSSAVVASPELGPTNDANFYDIVTKANRFNPPQKTEGGFVPREPPYFDPLFHSSDLNLEIGTGVTVAPETVPVLNPHRKNDVLPNNCLYEEHEYSHGQVLPSTALCVTCLCYYGEIRCTTQKCPALKIGCQQINDPNDKCCPKVVCADGVESPTVVLDRVDLIPLADHEPTVSPDPFRDVIKTEPAPDLPSLIGDMMIPYLVGITTPKTTTTSAKFSDYVVPDSHNDSHNDEVGMKPSSTLLDQQKQKQKHQQPHWNLVSQYNVSNFSADDITLTSTDINPIIGSEKLNDEDDSIFSLDSVLNLFFNEPSSTTNKFNDTTMKLLETSTTESTTTTTTTTTSTPKSTTSLPSSTSSVTVTSTPRVTSSTKKVMTSKKNLSTTKSPIKKTIEKDPSSTASLDSSGPLLRLAGCNIYGKMYHVGKIIIELSDSCRECRCTEVGVQCKPLDC